MSTLGRAIGVVLERSVWDAQDSETILRIQFPEVQLHRLRPDRADDLVDSLEVCTHRLGSSRSCHRELVSYLELSSRLDPIQLSKGSSIFCV